jgi:hypothetical protein
MKLIRSCLPIFSVLFLLLSCGGSSEQGNSFRPRVTGCVTTITGSRKLEVALVPEEYNPITDDTSLVLTTKTDSSGDYTIEDVVPGNYYLNAFDPLEKLRLLRGPYTIDEAKEEVGLGNDTAKPTATLVATLPEGANDTIIGLYVKGTSRYVTVANNFTTITIPSVPAGELEIIFVSHSSSESGVSTETFISALDVAVEDTLGISYQNRPPVLQSTKTSMIAVYEYGRDYRDTVFAEDPEGDDVTFSILEAPEGLTVDSVTGEIDWQPSDSTVMKPCTISVQVTDNKGAFSILTWVIESAISSAAPQSSIRSGERFCIPDTIYSYEAFPVSCGAVEVQYRFAWGEEDTSGWSTSPSATHIWESEETTFVKVQVRCGDSETPSEWSLPYDVIVMDSLIVEYGPIAVYGQMHANRNEAVLLYTDSLTCTDAEYEFSINDTTIFSSSQTVVLYQFNDTGTYSVEVNAWCTSSKNRIYRSEQPLVLNVYESTEPQVLLMGPDMVILGDTIFLEADIPSCSGGYYEFYLQGTPINIRSDFSYEMYLPESTGEYFFTVAGWCDTSEVPFLSETLSVTVVESGSGETLLPLFGPEDVYIGDTVYLYSDTLSCPGALFQFYVYDTAFTPVKNFPDAVYIPGKTGMFQFSMKAWCDTSGMPTYYSEILYVYVNDTVGYSDSVLTLSGPYDINTRDTIMMCVGSFTCPNVLFQFFYNDNAISERTPQECVKFYPRDSGVYTFTAAAWCDTFPEPYAISDTLYVSVIDSTDLENQGNLRVVISGQQSVEVYDTVKISADMSSCSEPQYQFFCNDTAFTELSYTDYTAFVPTMTGYYSFTVEAWCDSIIASPIETDVLVITVFPPIDTCKPVLEIDPIPDSNGTYHFDTHLIFQVCTDTLGTGCDYRFTLHNVDSVVYDTSVWVPLSDTLLTVPFEAGAQYEIGAQMRCLRNYEFRKSLWSVETVTITE